MMSGKRKAKSKSAPTSCKNNLIFTGCMDSDEFQNLCLTILDCEKNLRSEVFEYGIVGARVSIESNSKGEPLFNVFGYVQIKSERWNRRELLQRLKVNVTTYTSTEIVFGYPKRQCKPNSREASLVSEDQTQIPRRKKPASPLMTRMMNLKWTKRKKKNALFDVPQFRRAIHL